MEGRIAGRIERTGAAIRATALRALGSAVVYLDRDSGNTMEDDNTLVIDITELSTMFDDIGVPQNHDTIALRRDAAATALESAYQQEPDRELADRILYNLQYFVLGDVDDEGYSPYHKGLEQRRYENPLLTLHEEVNESDFIKQLITKPTGADTYRHRVNYWESYVDIGEMLDSPYLSRIWMAHKVTPDKRESVLNLSIGINTDQLGRGDLRGLATLATLQDYVMRFPHRPEEDVLNRHQQGDASIVYRLTNELALLCQLDMQSERVNFIVQALDVNAHDATDEDKDSFFEEAVTQQVDIIQELYPNIIDDVFNILGAEKRPSLMIAPAIGATDTMADEVIRDIYGVERAQLDVPPQLHSKDMIDMYNALTALKPVHTLDMIGGMDEVLGQLIYQADKFKRGERLRRAGTEPQPRVLLKGPPGVAKTAVAEAIASYLGGPLLRVSPKDLGSKYYNEGEQKVSLVFRIAAAIATPERPVVLLLDDLDTSTSNRANNKGDNEAQTRALGQMLTEMQMVLPNVFIIGATNAEGDIDPALIRAERFNHLIEVPAPDENTIRQIIEKRIATHVAASKGILPVENGLDSRMLAKLAMELNATGAAITTAVREAIERAELDAHNRGDDTIQTLTAENIEKALRMVMSERSDNSPQTGQYL